MPIFATNDAKAFWEARENRSRSLAADRFSPQKGDTGNDDDSYRIQHTRQLSRGEVHPGLLEQRTSLYSLVEEQAGRFIFAKPEARLLLNTSSGVVENGGLCLDRNSGVPYVPGSAVKGVARRHAIWSLSQETNRERKVRMLAEIALIFGYGDQEWQAGRKPSDKHPHTGPAKSDFWLAMAPLENAGTDFDQTRDEAWNHISASAKLEITQTLHLDKFPFQLSGCISFFPAFPEKDPGIEQDILTSHHPDYYKVDLPVATDNENPNPLVFPAIPAGTAFLFPLLKCQSFSTPALEEAAANHLKEALQLFGLGAKTNAGYGWFSIDLAAQRRADQKRAEADEERKRKERRDGLSEEELVAEDLKELDPAEFARVIGSLENEEPEKQKAACQMLLTSQKENWKNWRRQKKGKWTARVPKIREIAEQHNIELP